MKIVNNDKSNYYIYKFTSFLLTYGTKPNEWDPNSIVKFCKSGLLTIKPPEVPKNNK